MKRLLCGLIVSFLTVCISSGQEFISPGERDSLLALSSDASVSDSLRVEALLVLLLHNRPTEPVLAIEFGERAIDIAKAAELHLSHGKALLQTGVVYWRMGDLSYALDLFYEAHRIYTSHKDAQGIARSSVNIGIVMKEQAQYEIALGFFFAAYRIYAESGDRTGMSRVLNNIGVAYYTQGEYELARQYHMESLAIKQEDNDERGIAFSLYNLGLISQQMGDYSAAFGYFFDSYTIRERYQDLREMASNLASIGFLYMQTGDLKKATDYLKQALRFYTEVDDRIGIAQTHYQLGKVYLHKRNPELAEEQHTLSLQLAAELSMPRLELDNYGSLAETMASRGLYQEAYNYQKQFQLLYDSIFDDESKQRIVEMQAMYDRDRREQEIELLMNKNTIGDLNLEKQKVLRNFLIIVVMLVGFFLLLVYNRYVFSKKTNQLLEGQKKEISEKNEKLTELNQRLLKEKAKVEELNRQLQVTNKRLSHSEQHLMESNATKDKFFSIISHELKNPFAAIASFANLLKRDMEILSRKELQILAGELDQAVWKINTLLENLLQWSRSQTGRLSFHPEVLDMYSIGMENLQLFENRAKEKGITLTNHMTPDTKAYADPNMIHTVMRNLLSNAIKYSDTRGVVAIRSEIKDGMRWFHIADNGIGISSSDQEKIFRSDSLFSTHGTREEKGSGIGLLLCKEFVESNKGQIVFTSKEGEGSVFSFSLPLADDASHIRQV
jgi:signal transduction histidine kinase